MLFAVEGQGEPFMTWGAGNSSGSSHEDRLSPPNGSVAPFQRCSDRERDGGFFPFFFFF